MIGYDDEWFAEAIHDKLCDTVSIDSVPRSMFQYANCIAESVFDAKAMGLLS